MKLWRQLRAVWDLKRRLDALQEAYEDATRSWRRRLDELDEDLGYLRMDMSKLRGRVTGGTRANRGASESGAGEGEGSQGRTGGQANVEEIDRLIRQGRLEL